MREPSGARRAGRGPSIETLTGISALEARHGRLFVAVGVFDGLHLGHLYLLRKLRAAARRHGARTAVITFDAHPREIVTGTAPPLLCDPDERLVRLADAGVEVIVVQHFDETLRMTEYDAFVEMIRSRVDLAGFLMTPDAAFGFERRGTPEAVAELGRREGFEVVIVPPLLVDGKQVRSSEIRREVSEGNLAGVRDLLGRQLSVVGQCDGTAPSDRTLWFPVPVALPPDGAYRVAVGPAWIPGVEPLLTARPARADVRGEVRRIAIHDAAADDDCERLRVVFEERLAAG